MGKPFSREPGTAFAPKKGTMLRRPTSLEIAMEKKPAPSERPSPGLSDDWTEVVELRVEWPMRHFSPKSATPASSTSSEMKARWWPGEACDVL
jgi:hypothetical protein